MPVFWSGRRVSTNALPAAPKSIWKPGNTRFHCLKNCNRKSCKIWSLTGTGKWITLYPYSYYVSCSNEPKSASDFNCTVILHEKYDSDRIYPYWCGRPTCNTVPDWHTTMLHWQKLFSLWKRLCPTNQPFLHIRGRGKNDRDSEGGEISATDTATTIKIGGKTTNLVHRDKKKPQRLRRAPIEKDNVATTIMAEFAHQRNMTNCWICQHLPMSFSSRIVTPVPFTMADWYVIDWQGNANEMLKNDSACYTPPPHVD